MLTLDPTILTADVDQAPAVRTFDCPRSENLHCPMTNSETCPSDPKVQARCSVC